MPQNHHMAEVGIEDSRAEALAYMGRLTAGRTPVELLERYVDRGPGILAELERTTPLRLRPMTWPDYHPEMEGAKVVGPDARAGALRHRPARAVGRPPPAATGAVGLPITLQEATVEWRPTYTPERFDAAEVQARVAEPARWRAARP